MAKIFFGVFLGVIFGCFFATWALVLTSLVLFAAVLLFYQYNHKEIEILFFWNFTLRILAFFIPMLFAAIIVRWQPSWTEGLKLIFLR